MLGGIKSPPASDCVKTRLKCTKMNTIQMSDNPKNKIKTIII